MCSPRGEVTIQESCFLKGFFKTMGLPGEQEEGRWNTSFKGLGVGEKMGILFLAPVAGL